MRIWNSLQAKFFVTYSFILITIMLIVSIPMYIYLKNDIEKNMKNGMNETISKIKDRLDDRMNQFDVISRLFYLQTNISGTPAVNYLNDLLSSEDYYANFQSKYVLRNFVTTLSVFYPDAYSIRVLSTSGDLISNQLNDSQSIKPLKEYPSLVPILESRGQTLLNYFSQDPWLASNDTPIFAFSRLLSPWESQAGILQVEVKADELLSLDRIKQIKGANLSLLFNGNVVYSTLQDEDGQMSNAETAYLQSNSSGNAPLLRQTPNGKEYIFHQYTNSGIGILLTVPEKVIFAPLNFFRNVAIGTILLLILFTVTVFYILSRILTHPLKDLRKSIDLIDLDDKELGMDNKYQMDEIHLINRSFRSMNNRLQNSLEETVRFRTLQLQANFDMLQAQINPHFLFNMLGFIQSSAEDKDLEQVHALSRNLLGFFRYSISAQSPVITLEKEVEFTKQFLELMQTRFMHRLRYTLEIDPLLLNFVVPKMTLQPLVENCIHHGFNDRMNTLEIQIRAFVDGACWEIQINDNGSGFTEERLTALNEKVAGYISRMYSSMEGERLSLGGMGMASTISRLKLMFKEKFSYTIGNHESSGGAAITLRGPLKR